jgi:hypothetical protein
MCSSEGIHREDLGVGWADYLLQLDKGELQVCALRDLVLIPGDGRRGCSGDVVRVGV